MLTSVEPEKLVEILGVDMGLLCSGWDGFLTQHRVRVLSGSLCQGRLLVFYKTYLHFKVLRMLYKRRPNNEVPFNSEILEFLKK